MKKFSNRIEESETKKFEENITGKIEERLIQLIKESEERLFYSDREPLLQNLIISEFYTNGAQIEFKESINHLLYKYQNVDENIGYGIIYYLFEICQDVKIPEIESTLLQILKTKTLKGKKYNNKDLDLFILQLLIDLPITHRTKVEVTNLIKVFEYKENIGYSLHCLELFSKINSESGVKICLNNLVDLQINESQIGLVFYRLADTLRFVEPQLVKNWYFDLLKKPKALNKNIINEALLKFVSFAKKKESYFGTDWYSTFNLINCFSFVYSPQNNFHYESATQILATFSSLQNNFEIEFQLDRNKPEIRKSLDAMYDLLNVTKEESTFEFMSENMRNGFVYSKAAAATT